MLVISDPFSVIMLRLELRALIAFASRDDSRPHIAAVVLRHDGAFATDGVVMLAGHWENPLPEFDPIVLERYPLKRLLRAVPRNGGVRITPDGGSCAAVEVMNGLHLLGKWDDAKPVFEATVPIASASAPPYETVLDQKVTTRKTPSRFNARLLHRMLIVDEAALAAGRSGESGVEVEFGGGAGRERDPTRLRWLDFQQRWTALLMPLSST